MKITDLIKLPEGRRLEFKETIPKAQDLAKTIVAFANDAGGELYIGIKDEPREIVGVNQNMVLELEEQFLVVDHNNPMPKREYEHFKDFFEVEG